MICVSKFELSEFKIASYNPYGKQNFCEIMPQFICYAWKVDDDSVCV